jgi:type I restriction enzyme S subunit
MSADLRTTPLSDYLSVIQSGWSPACDELKPGINEWGVIRVSAVTQGVFREDEAKQLPHLLEPRPWLEITPGDLLMARANGAKSLVGVACLVGDVRGKLMLSDKTLRLRADPLKGTPEFLHHVLRSRQVRSQIDALLGGSTGQANISQKDVATLQVPNFSLPEQARIVEILDAFQSRIDVEEAALRKRDDLWNGVLNEELERHAKEYGSSRLCDVSRGGGAYGSNASANPHRIDMPRYVRITDINDRGFLSPVESGAASIPPSVAARYLLAEGDLLIARTGFTTGKSYLYRSSDGLCAFAGYLVRFRIDPDEMLPEYAFLWCSGSGFRKWVSRNIREVGQRNISAREYNEHKVAHPPIPVQQKLVEVAQAAREEYSSRTAEIGRLHTLRRSLADDLLEGRVNMQLTL